MPPESAEQVLLQQKAAPVGSGDPATQTSAANAVNNLDFAAVAGERHYLTSLSYHYSGANPVGDLTVESPAGTVLWRDRFPATLNVSRTVDLPDGGIRGAVGQALRISAPAGGAGITSTINAAKTTAP